ERIHPHLKNVNLLPEQIEACHRRDIRVPIYVTVQWDEYTADRQRDWLCIDEKGTEFGTAPLQAGFYRFLDVFHPGYRDFLREHVREILETMPVDGFFFDIVQPRWSLAAHWIDAMDEAGLHPEDEGDRQRFANRVINEWKREMTDFVRGFNPDATIFYNSGHVGPRHRATLDAYTHYELESLPSGGWGYLHFPQTMRYARGMGHDTMGMTGKFHTSWGDFSSYKNPPALQFECFQMLALGAKCSVGDQLPPNGELDPHTYDLIGGVYGEVERKEAWVQGAAPVVEVGVLTPEEFVMSRAAFHAKSERDQPAIMGAVRMLQELQVQFDILDSERDFSAYRVIVLPDAIPVDETLAGKLKAYLNGGGAVLASYRSGLTPEGDRFALEEWGVTYKGPAPYSPDFLVPGDLIREGLAPTEYVMYLQGLEVEPSEGAEVLARVEVPYFNRTWRHFCSHRHTPSSGQIADYPGIVQAGNVIYFMHPVFAQYQENAPRWCKQMVDNALRRVLPERLVAVDGPTSLLASLNRQAGENRYVLHLLHYVPERRGQAFDVIEDVIPLYDVKASVAAPEWVSDVRLVPGGEALEFDQTEGRVRFTVPKVNGHAMVEIEYA
ncbi:MAG: beta-galactosidase trimerization domain-containing protein, partial [Armatimonadetes bacterium]|nr:beta-galactosidase trimerization domain-containing protein [Armatimonadota bacterium]